MGVHKLVCAGTSYFGEGAREALAEVVGSRRFKKALLVTDGVLVKAGLTEKVEEILGKQYTPYSVFSGVRPNPTAENVQSGADAFAAAGADFIVAVGGGSVIDTAKGIAVLSRNPENRDVASLEGRDVARRAAAPVIALPTTAGTGSETTMDFVITSVREKRKMACMDSRAVPIAAILDTELLAAMPPRLTAATALDALTHAVESYLARGAFDMTEALSLDAARLISDNYMRVLEKPDDLDARGKLAAASYMAGVSFTNAGLGIVHSMAHPLGAFYDVPHGIANALILPRVLEFNARGCPEKINHLAAVLDKAFSPGGSPGGAPSGAPGGAPSGAARICADAVRRFIAAAGLPGTLREVGVRAEDLDALSRSALTDASTPDNPVDVTLEDIRELYQEIL